MKIPRQGHEPGWRSRGAAIPGFSLVELLVALGIVAILAALIASSVQSATRKARAAQCMSVMRNLGQGILLYTQDHGEFPRSYHSCAGAGKQPWAKAILPYLGHPADPTPQEWSALFERSYRCPTDKSNDTNIYSYALNVFYELTPDGDDYVGSPSTWRKPVTLPSPSSTILLAEPKAVYYADHLMCHLWTSAKGAANAVDAQRHDRRSNYLFADGHVETLQIEATFDLGKPINLWNPSLAGKR